MSQNRFGEFKFIDQRVSLEMHREYIVASDIDLVSIDLTTRTAPFHVRSRMQKKF